MAKGQQRDPSLEVRWREVLRRHGRSGLSVREFCRRERLPESAFYAWRRTIHQRDTHRPTFLPVVVQTEDQPHRGITIELRGGRILRLPLSMPPAQLAALIHAIETAGDVA